MTRSSRTRLLSGAPEMSVELSQHRHGCAHVHMHTHTCTHMHTHTRTPAALERSLLLHTGVIPEVYGVPAASEMRPSHAALGSHYQCSPSLPGMNGRGHFSFCPYMFIRAIS